MKNGRIITKYSSVGSDTQAKLLEIDFRISQENECVSD